MLFFGETSTTVCVVILMKNPNLLCFLWSFYCFKIKRHYFSNYIGDENLMNYNLNSKKYQQRAKIVAMFLSLFILLSMAPIAFCIAIREGPSVNQYVSESYVSNVTATQVIQLDVSLIDEPILFSDIQYIEPITADGIESQIHSLDLKINELETECNNEFYTDNAIESMRFEINRLKEISSRLDADFKKINRWENEYYYATAVWTYLRGNGYSESVVAGILGNMMAEVSGGSLDLDPKHYSRNGQYYGLCQWSLYYRPYVADMSFEDQLDYLVNGIEQEFETYGHLYENEFTFNDFMAMEDPVDVAFVFAKVYERCAPGSYGLRQEYAIKAYNYFTGD